jgi:hypothetical protein
MQQVPNSGEGRFCPDNRTGFLRDECADNEHNPD